MRKVSILSLALLAATLAASPAWAGDFASQVISYDQGGTYPAPDPNDFSFVPPLNLVNITYGNASGALGGLNGDTGFGAVTPFNGAFSPNDYVGVGEGGHLTLKLSSPIRTDGFTLGVHTAVGLIDFDYPNGSTSLGAFPYTPARQSNVEVSANGFDWVSLGGHEFDNPSNFYAQGVVTPGYQPIIPGLVPADQQKPFTGSLADFGGKDWNGILTLLDGSAGGTWLDLSGTGLSEVQYVRFSVDEGHAIYVDSVTGVPTPEPASLSALGAGVVLLLVRRRR